jgi:GNAT superfamily N-acetyltransferase
MIDDPTYTTRALGPDTWDDFATLVEANNGVWGGCWCMGFHPEGLDREDASANRGAKRAHVEQGTVHQMLVYADDDCVGWCQYGTATELPNIKNPKAYAKDLGSLPDWRIGCIFTDKSHRGQGVERAAVTAALATIKEAGAGIVEAYPETGRRATSAARVLPAHRPRDPVRGARLLQGPTDHQVALGDASDRGCLITTGSDF